MATNHADASGLTSSNPWAGVDGDGATELALAAPSQGQDAVRRLGSPTHVGCCPKNPRQLPDSKYPFTPNTK